MSGDRVLSISLDQGLFDRRSDVFERHRFYASLVTSYTVIVPVLEGEKRSLVREGNLTVIGTRSRTKFLYLLDILRLAGEQKGSSLVTCQDPFLTGLAGLILKYVLQIPLNVQVHSEFFSSGYFRRESIANYLYYLLGGFIVGRADTVRARNKRIAADLAARYPRLAGRIFYVPARLNESYFQKLSKLRRQKNLIVSVGRLVAQKNFLLLVRAYGRVLARLPRVRLRIYGDGPERAKLQGAIKKMGLGGKVEVVTRWVSPRQLSRIFDRSGVLVVSSNHEGWALTALEALSRGCPVVMTDTGCAGEIVVDKKSGYVVAVGDFLALANAMVAALKNYAVSLKMARLGRKLVVKEGDRDRIRRLMLLMFRQTTSWR